VPTDTLETGHWSTKRTCLLGSSR